MPENNEDKNNDLDKKAWIKFWALAAAKMQKIVGILVIPELILGYIGYRLDQKFSTEPLYFLALVIVAFIVSIVILLRFIKNKE